MTKNGYILLAFLITFSTVLGATQALEEPEKLMEEKCTICHDLSKVKIERTTVEWEEIMVRMQNYGVQVSEEEFNALLDYFQEKYMSEEGIEEPLHGFDLVEKKCTVCHSSLLLEIPRTKSEWEEEIVKMRSYGASLSEDEGMEISDLLYRIYGISEHPAKPEAILDEVWVKAAYNDEYVYLQFKWRSPQNIEGESFVYDDESGMWIGDNSLHEEKLNVMLAPRDLISFASGGCFVTCHSTEETSQMSKYLLGSEKMSPLELNGMMSEGRFIDLWSWKPNLGGLADDQYILRFRNSDSGHPVHLLNWNHEKNEPLFYHDGVKWLQFDPSQNLAGNIVPKYIGRVASGSRGDVRAKAKWSSGFWTLELRRKLYTGEPDDIALQAGSLYTIGVSIHSNTYGAMHLVSFPHAFTLGTDSHAGIKAVNMNGKEVPDWERIPSATLKLFFPNGATWERISSGQRGTWHPFTKGATLLGEALCSNCHVEGRFENLVSVWKEDGFTVGAATCQTCMREEDAAKLANGKGIGGWWYLNYAERSGEFSQRSGYPYTDEGKAQEIRDIMLLAEERVGTFGQSLGLMISLAPIPIYPLSLLLPIYLLAYLLKKKVAKPTESGGTDDGTLEN